MDIIQAKPDGKGLKVGVVVSRFNSFITDKLLEGAKSALTRSGVAEKDINVVSVPGAFEIPLVLNKMAVSKKFDALVALGAVIRGETPHFDYVAAEASRGVADVMKVTGIPVGFGVLTTNDVDQALERSGGKHGNKGEEAALVALEMVNLLGLLVTRNSGVIPAKAGIQRSSMDPRWSLPPRSPLSRG